MTTSIKTRTPLAAAVDTTGGDRELEAAALVFKAIAHPGRLRVLLVTWEHGPGTIKKLHAHLPRMNEPQVRAHLRDLTRAGLVTYQRADPFGQWGVTSELPEKLRTLIESLEPSETASNDPAEVDP